MNYGIPIKCWQVLTVKERQCMKPSRTAVIQTDRFAADFMGVGRKYNLADLPGLFDHFVQRSLEICLLQLARLLVMSIL